MKELIFTGACYNSALSGPKGSFSQKISRHVIGSFDSIVNKSTGIVEQYGQKLSCFLLILLGIVSYP
jgi:hypothetical protein